MCTVYHHQSLIVCVFFSRLNKQKKISIFVIFLFGAKGSKGCFTIWMIRYVCKYSWAVLRVVPSQFYIIMDLKYTFTLKKSNSNLTCGVTVTVHRISNSEFRRFSFVFLLFCFVRCSFIRSLIWFRYSYCVFCGIICHVQCLSCY